MLYLEEASVGETNADKEHIKSFIYCFDRLAIQDRISQEGRAERHYNCI